MPNIGHLILVIEIKREQKVIAGRFYDPGSFILWELMYSFDPVFHRIIGYVSKGGVSTLPLLF